MSREIKFRFYDKEYKQWCELPDLYGDYQASAFRTYGDGFEMRHFLSGEAQEKIKDGELIIQQFTGLTDKLGREIYEGDILKYSNLNYEVIWSEYQWIATCPNYCRHNWPKFENFGREARASEIIGNIFENPKLLKTP